MSDKFPYKLVYVNSISGWCVVQEATVPEINQKTGKPNKAAGELKESAVAWPHKFEFAPMSLLRLAVPDGAIVKDLDDWRRVHQEAIDTILEAIKEWKND